MPKARIETIAVLSILLILGCRKPHLTEQDINAAQAKRDMAALHPTPAIDPKTGQRATSTPYSGDLSVFEYPDRDKKLQIDRVMTLLGIAKGKSVADIGAGSGWFTVRAAKRVGRSGTVFAEDINPKSAEYIDARARKAKLGNVRMVVGLADDAKLPPAAVDAVLMLKMYHEIASPIPFMVKLRASLRPGAKVGIIDRNGNGSATDHGVPQPILEREMTRAGYREIDQWDFTKPDGEDYFLIFEPIPGPR